MYTYRQWLSCFIKEGLSDGFFAKSFPDRTPRFIVSVSGPSSRFVTDSGVFGHLGIHHARCQGEVAQATSQPFCLARRGLILDDTMPALMRTHSSVEASGFRPLAGRSRSQRISIPTLPAFEFSPAVQSPTTWVTHDSRDTHRRRAPTYISHRTYREKNC
ncbi:hypothetical protein BDR22DRAFT_68191 [Usnea florida]